MSFIPEKTPLEKAKQRMNNIFEEAIKKQQEENIALNNEIETPTPSDTFIEEKMREFDSCAMSVNQDGKEGVVYLMGKTLTFREFLKSSLQEQREAIEKEFTDKLIKLLAESESLETTKEIRTRIKDLII
jgi:hypothetical protein